MGESPKKDKTTPRELQRIFPVREDDLTEGVRAPTQEDLVLVEESARALANYLEEMDVQSVVETTRRFEENIANVKIKDTLPMHYDPNDRTVVLPGGVSHTDNILRVHELGHTAGKNSVYGSGLGNKEASSLKSRRKERTMVQKGGAFTTVLQSQKHDVVLPAKLGVVSIDRWFRSSFFGGLMEAINDSQAHWAYQKSRHPIARMYSRDRNVYRPERQLLLLMIEGIREATGKSRREIKQMFLTVHNRGWTKECKNDLWLAFGPNALRVLAVLETDGYARRREENRVSGPKIPTLSKFHQSFMTFFETIDIGERERAARKILAGTGIPYRELDNKEKRHRG